VEDARRIVARFVAEYNDARLHSAIGYVVLVQRKTQRAVARVSG